MKAYLDQISVSQRATSVGAVSLALRHLAAYLVVTHPDCSSVTSINRSHIEGYKLALAARPGHKGAISKTTIRHNPGMVRTFFERIVDWDRRDAPGRVPIFAGDIPKADEPLPKFLDDPTAAKFMATLAVDPDRRRRLLVELLARTGMRAGELASIRDDAMYKVGDTLWLRIPIGKLHNDRNVPLHPLLVGLISDYQAWRGPSRNGYLLEREDGQPLDRRTIHRYVERMDVYGHLFRDEGDRTRQAIEAALSPANSGPPISHDFGDRPDRQGTAKGRVEFTTRDGPICRDRRREPAR